MSPGDQDDTPIVKVIGARVQHAAYVARHALQSRGVYLGYCLTLKLQGPALLLLLTYYDKLEFNQHVSQWYL